jgi:DNA-binding SARP family transcriptional activator
MATSLRLQVLGTPNLAREMGGPATALQGQGLALLAVLACAGERGIAREKVVTLLWPESAASAASHRLSQLAHSIRRTLRSPALISGTGELRLDPGSLRCDLWEFLEARRAGRLERAAELYGPFLDGFFLTGSAEFDRWAEGRRAELAREYQETLEALAVHAEARGDSLGAAEWWERLARHEPLSSRVTMHLMTALAASGERARALAHAQAYQRQVRTDLDAEPSPAVVALARLLKREPGAAATPSGLAIGVLPIVGLGDDARARSLAEGLTEEIMTALGETVGVRVASRTALTAAQRETPDIRELGARLGLGALLEGSVRLAGGRLRLSVRLVDASDGCHRCTERWELPVEDAMADEAALARDVAERLRRRLLEAGN